MFVGILWGTGFQDGTLNHFLGRSLGHLPAGSVEILRLVRI
jgi:hypothetical protein